MRTINEETTDRRLSWIFRYQPAEVLAAAETKLKHHIKREEWWTDEYKKAEDHLKEKGFEYRERPNSMDPHQVQIVGDPELAQRAAKCRIKIVEHHQKRELYETWTRALKLRSERRPDEEMELAINDIVFFGL